MDIVALADMGSVASVVYGVRVVADGSFPAMGVRRMILIMLLVPFHETHVNMTGNCYFSTAHR